jgi:hypothetical protein
MNDMSTINNRFPLGDADQTALRSAVLHDLEALPYIPGALVSRSLWIIFVGRYGAWTHASLPVEDSLGMADEDGIAALCDLVGSLVRPPACHKDEKAMIVLRRPGSAEISEADACIFRLIRRACAGRKTAPWAFYMVGTGGMREVTEHEIPQAVRVAEPDQSPVGSESVPPLSHYAGLSAVSRRR